MEIKHALAELLSWSTCKDYASDPWGMPENKGAEPRVPGSKVLEVDGPKSQLTLFVHIITVRTWPDVAMWNSPLGFRWDCGHFEHVGLSRRVVACVLLRSRVPVKMGRLCKLNTFLSKLQELVSVICHRNSGKSGDERPTPNPDLHMIRLIWFL